MIRKMSRDGTKMKLTLVSVYCRGKTLSLFIPLPYKKNALGKMVAVCDMQIINSALDAIGCKDRGLTFSIG